MNGAAPPGTVSSLTASVRVLVDRLLALAALEGRRASVSLAVMLGLALAAAVLVVTGWMAVIAAVVLALVRSGVVGWGWALAIAAVASFAGAGGLVVLLIRRSGDLTFPATRRQLSELRAEEGEDE
jgi:hypothetical protein